ncbi:uncharacterized protein METZ01_LOCUS139159, partial [marine metagenome]
VTDGPSIPFELLTPLVPIAREAFVQFSESGH